MPFGIMSHEPSGTSPFGYAFGELVTLKQPAQQGEAGNFQFLSLTDPPGGHDGANDINGALSGGGVDNAVYLDTLYNTRTGMTGSNVTKNLGYSRLITYTRADESGASLRGAGWRVVAERAARKGWDAPSRPRIDKGTGGVKRTLWEAPDGP